MRKPILASTPFTHFRSLGGLVLVVLAGACIIEIEHSVAALSSNARVGETADATTSRDPSYNRGPAVVLEDDANRDYRYSLRRLFRRQQSQKGSSSSIDQHHADHRGTRFSLRYPTVDRVARWYGRIYHSKSPPCAIDDESNSDSNTGMLPSPCGFNHNLVGMTNPNLQVSDAAEMAAMGISWNNTATVSEDDDKSIKLVSSIVLPTASEDCWWPGMAQEPNNNEWRVLRFRQRVGKGQDCYEQCRDAALAWEFQGVGQGMVRVEDSRPERKSGSASHAHNNQCQEQDQDCKSSQSASLLSQTWAPGRRRFVTYTSFPKRGGPFVPHLYTVNPVAVVYAAVDQRAPGTTCTATAYATLAGHFLCGEERVTVCHRDHDNGVDVEILSVSRASDSFPGRWVWPLVGPLQRSFFSQQLHALQRVADATQHR